MKITITPIQEQTERTRKKLIESKAGDKRTASITGEGYNTPHNTEDTRRTIEITNNETGDDRTRTNDNGGPEVDQMEAMNQLEQARTEYEDYMKEEQEKANEPIDPEKMKKATAIAEKQRARFFDRNEHEQERVDPTDSMNTRTEQEHQDRVKESATLMVQISK